jgi:hypothetical protein
MPTYTIQINEDQRKILQAALTVIHRHYDEMAADLSHEEIGLLLDMTTNLPSEEESEPGCLHGFCL